MPIAQGLVQLTDDRNLPRTNFVWFEARVFDASTLLGGIGSQQKLKSAMCKIGILLQFVQEECTALASEWWGDEDKGQLFKEVQTGRLLKMLGRAHKYVADTLKPEKMYQNVQDERITSLLCYENALENFNSAYNRGAKYLASNIKQTEHHINDIKFEMGLVSIDQRVEDLRTKLDYLKSTDGEIYLVRSCIVFLCDALMLKDPPEYFETIKLYGEMFAVLERDLGSEHLFVQEAKTRLLDLKREYREYLEKLKSS